jgi:UDP-2-acetamido-3-amino-2,3-dideoxy-glucuronate N-acetyltransferase
MVFTNVMNPRAFVERKAEFKNTLVKKGCSIGANATIVCGTTLGEYAFIGAGAVVTKDVPNFGMVAGVPAKQIGWMSKYGEKLIFNNEGIAICSTTNEKYTLLNNLVSIVLE